MLPPLNHYAVSQIVHAFGANLGAWVIMVVIVSVVLFMLAAKVYEVRGRFPKKASALVPDNRMAKGA